MVATIWIFLAIDDSCRLAIAAFGRFPKRPLLRSRGRFLERCLGDVAAVVGTPRKRIDAES